MLDNTIPGHSQFVEWRNLAVGVSTGNGLRSVCVGGFVRRKADSNSAYQRQIDALVTVGKLIREHRIQAFTYIELVIEGWRRGVDESAFNGLAGCQIKKCDAPLERSRFFRTAKFTDYMVKGDKDDEKYGEDTSISQIRFVEFLLGLTEDHAQALISSRELLRMTPFEIESLHNLPWFRAMCRIAQSSKNYPDMLHIWAAQRNRMDVFLTLETTLPNIAEHFPKKKGCTASFPTVVLQPLQLLERLGIADPDPVPIQFGYFYPIVGLPFPITDDSL
jgi:hypothetical protein